MDVVIPFVDGRDPLWQKDYETYAGGPLLAKRYRDWGTLRYLMRGIEKHMPFIENVFLLVSRESQVPEWVDRNNVRIILHSDFIPKEYLPTFSSSMIEMFLHCISCLSEKYLYFNDDMFPVADCQETDFYVDGKSAIDFSRAFLATGNFRRRVRRSDRLAKEAVGKRQHIFYLRPQHTCSPMQKSACKELFKLKEKEILASLTRLRSEENFNQYLYLDYIYYTGRAIARRISNKHFSLAVASLKTITHFIEHPTKKLVCINDVTMSQEKYNKYKAGILASFEKRFPDKSRFEK